MFSDNVRKVSINNFEVEISEEYNTVVLSSQNITGESILLSIDTSEDEMDENELEEIIDEFYIYYLKPSIGEAVSFIISELENLIDFETLTDSIDVNSKEFCKIRHLLKALNFRVFSKLPTDYTSEEYNQNFLKPAMKEVWKYIKKNYHENEFYEVPFYMDEDEKLQILGVKHG